MSRFERYAPGQFSWVDLMTPDTTGAARFYGALFGWTPRQAPNDAGGIYVMFGLGGDDVAGMGERPAELAQVPPHWTSYVTVEDVEKAVARAQELGAQVTLAPMSIESGGERVGRMAMLVDPAGAAFSLWEAGRHAGSALANVPGAFCWNELCTRDPDASACFYTALFGWRVGPGDAENGYRTIQVGERLNGGLLPWRPEMGDVPTAWSVYFAVEDCDAAVARAEAEGGRCLMGPADVEAGRFAVVADPQGAVFQVMKVHAPDD